jgi:DNA-directed RNA polymerase subunit RPC12/RpoP
MDFLEDLFDRGDRNRRRGGGSYQNGDHSHDDHNQGYEHQNRYPPNNPQGAPNGAAFLPGVACPKCGIQTVQGAKFCHGCGAGMAMITNCGGCGAKLPESGIFCPQCGYKNG